MNPQLIQWIREEIRKGVSVKDIGNILLNHGYTKSQINQAFLSANKPQQMQQARQIYPNKNTVAKPTTKKNSIKNIPIVPATSIAGVLILILGIAFFAISPSPIPESGEEFEGGTSTRETQAGSSTRNTADTESTKKPQTQRAGTLPDPRLNSETSQSNPSSEQNREQTQQESSDNQEQQANANDNDDSNNNENNNQQNTPTIVPVDAYCGDNIINNNEVCDGSSLGGKTCATEGFLSGTLYCKSDCTGFKTYACQAGTTATCGNGIAEEGEACDGTDFGQETCFTVAGKVGTLKCKSDCSAFDLSSCVSESNCGNNEIEASEICDNTNLGSQTCISQGFSGGTLRCRLDCKGFDTAFCIAEEQSNCGNNQLEGDEVCDGTFLNLKTCQTEGFDTGTLTCKSDCSGFDTSSCITAQQCSNNDKEGTEVCDGIDLDDETCESQGFGSGTLACKSDCSGFDTSSCVEASTCGDGVIEGAELCDSSNLNGETCNTQTFYSGTLSCKSDCSGFDTSQCTIEQCGNGVKEGAELCDGSDIGGDTCSSLGYGTGTLGCSPDCTWIDYTGCSEACGNGVIEYPELCDGSDLQGATCQTFDWDGGTLACNSQCDGFDMSGCFDNEV